MKQVCPKDTVDASLVARKIKTEKGNNKYLMKAYQKVSSNSGSTLMEVMIAASVSMLVFLGVMAIGNYQTKVAVTASIQAGLDDIKRQLQSWINTQSTCDFTFKGARNGDAIQGLRRKRDGNASDFIIQVGQRFPGSNWAIAPTSGNVKGMMLLSQTEAQTQYPTMSGTVSDNGMGMGVLRVILQQLAGGGGEVVQTSTSTSFVALTKTLFFPITAFFGDSIYSKVANCNQLDTGNQTSTGRCCLSCTKIGPPTETYAQYAAGLGLGVFNADTNPIFFSSDYNPSLPNSGCGVADEGFDGYCYIYNYNLPILACNSAIRDPMK